MIRKMFFRRFISRSSGRRCARRSDDLEHYVEFTDRPP